VKEIIRTYHNHWHQSRHDKPNIDLYVREKNKPSVSSTTLKFSGTFGTAYTACWVFTSNADTKKKSPCSQCGEQTRTATSSTVAACTECGKSDEDDCTGEQTPLAGVVV